MSEALRFLRMGLLVSKPDVFAMTMPETLGGMLVACSVIYFGLRLLAVSLQIILDEEDDR